MGGVAAGVDDCPSSVVNMIMDMGLEKERRKKNGDGNRLSHI